jgi:DNA-binding Xre family transcriptional regulator
MRFIWHLHNVGRVPPICRYHTFSIRLTASLLLKFVGIMSKELSTSQKKEWAEMLFLQGDISQKEIAAKVGVSENTITKWKDAGKWDALRKSMLTTKTEILRNLYNILDKINGKLKEEDSIGDTKIADMYVKYTAAIKNLETETSVGQISEVARMFVNWLQTFDPKFGLLVLNHFDKFMKEQLKRF